MSQYNVGDLQIIIEADASNAAQALLDLETALGKVRTAVSNGIGNATNIIDQFNRLTNAVNTAVNANIAGEVDKIAQALERLYNVNGTINIPNLNNALNAGGVSGATNAVSNAVGQVQNAANGLAGAIAPATASLNSMAQTMGNAAVAGNGLVNTQRELQTKTQGVSIGADKARDAVKNYGRESVFASRKTGGLIGAVSNLMRAFGRIALYRFLRTVIKAITTAFSEGLSNLRQYSEAINGHFNAAMTRADDIMLKFKNTLATGVAPILEALVPVLQTVTNWINIAINYLNQFISLLTGQATWTRAIDASAKSLEDVKKGAGGAAKAVKNLLADWDELNIIQSQPGNSGGAGSLNDAKKYANLFEEVTKFDERIKKIVAWLKDNLELVLGAAKLIGAALLGWQLSKVFTSGFGLFVRQLLGVLIAAEGLKRMWNAFSDQLENGIDWENFTELIEGAAIAVFGLGMAFGLKGIGSGLLIFSLAGIASALKDIVTNGEASKEALDQLKISVLAGGIGISLLTGNWIWGIAGGLAAAAIAVYENKEAIVGYIKDNIETITALLKDAGYAGIALGAMLALSGVSVVGGITMIATGIGLTMIGEGLDDTITDDVETTFKNIAKLVGQATMAVGAILAISGVATLPGIAMMAVGLGIAIYGSGKKSANGGLKAYLESAWNEIKQWAIPLSLGFFTTGAVLAVSGVAVVPGLKMMAIGAAGLGAGAAMGSLLDELKNVWAEIKSWALPLSLGAFALGTVLALSGFGIRAGLSLMTIGAAGLALGAVSGDLLEDLKKTWASIKGWARPLSLGAFALGAVLALTGTAIMPGLALMVVGAAGITADVAFGDLLGDIKRTWDEITKWSVEIMVGTFALGAILALTGVAVVPGLAMMLGAVGGMLYSAGSGSYKNSWLLNRLQEIWDGITKWSVEIMLGTFALGAILVLTGVGVMPGLAMMLASIGGMIYSVGSGSYKNSWLLNKLQGIWAEIEKWSFEIGTGSIALGLLLALTGVGVLPGLGMVMAGIGMVWHSVSSGGAENSWLLKKLKDIWSFIQEWSTEISVGSFALGLILALTGVGVVPGVAMMLAGIAGGIYSTATGAFRSSWLSKKLESAWSFVEKWGGELSAGSFALGALLALTGVGIVPGVIMMMAGIAGLATGDNAENLLDHITNVWNSIVNFYDTSIRPGLEAAVKWIHDTFIAPVIRFFDNVREAIDRVVRWFTGADKNEFLDADYVDWARSEAYQDIARNYDDNSTHAGKIRKALAYEIDMNNGQPFDVASDVAREMVNGMIQAFVNDEFGEDIYYIVDTLYQELKDYGWEYQDIIDLIDVKSLNTEQLENLLESIKALNEDNGLDLKAPEIDTSALDAGLGESEKTVANYVKHLKGSLGELNGISVGFASDGRFGGRFEVNFPVYTYANGGFPNTGDMFIANEGGSAEMIGRIGNRTAVANNDQIVSGVANGVAAGQAEQNSLLRTQNELLRRILAKDSSVKLVPSAQLGGVVRRSNEMYTKVAGV